MQLLNVNSPFHKASFPQRNYYEFPRLGPTHSFPTPACRVPRQISTRVRGMEETKKEKGAEGEPRQALQDCPPPRIADELPHPQAGMATASAKAAVQLRPAELWLGTTQRPLWQWQWQPLQPHFSRARSQCQHLRMAGKRGGRKLHRHHLTL